MKLHNMSRQRALQALCCVLAMAAPLLAQDAGPAAASVPYAGAIITDFKGTIALKSKAQGPIAPSRGLSLAAGTEVSTGGGKLLLHLSDGSEVLLGPRTRLILAQPSASDWNSLELIVGRLRAVVQKRLGGVPDFQIGTPSAVISVRGTRFLVEVNRLGVTEVDVDQGLVELKSSRNFGAPVLLGPGFSSRVGESSGPEPARPTRDFRPEVERPGREPNADHKLELDDIESRTSAPAERTDLSSFDEREASRPSAGTPGAEPSQPEPADVGPPEPNP